MVASKIGLVFFKTKLWTGSKNYLLHVLKSFESLDPLEQPELVAFYDNDEAKEELEDFVYPYLELVDIRLEKKRLINASKCLVTGIDYQMEEWCKRYKVRCLFPYMEPYRLQGVRTVAWCPDVKHRVMPELFEYRGVRERDQLLSKSLEYRDAIVLPAKCTLNEFNQYFKGESKAEKAVIPLVSSIYKSDIEDIKSVLKKYRIKGNYFFVSNPFRRHKNLMVVLEALKHLKKLGEECLVVFTGKEFEDEDDAYPKDIKNFANEHDLNEMVRFLGVVPRAEQIFLMKFSDAVIQPCFYEGWGAVVEDAKTLKKRALVSDIEFHREQLGDQADYFKAEDPKALADLMLESMIDPQDVAYPLFQQRRKVFMTSILEVLQG